MNPKVSFAVGLVSMSLLAPTGCNNNRAAEPAQKSPPAHTEVALAKPADQSGGGSLAKGEDAKSQQLPATFELSGVATASRTAHLSSKSSGLLQSILLREGNRVKKGQPLSALDATDVALRVEAATVAAEQAEEAYKNARRDFDRIDKLFKAGALPDANQEKAQMGLRMAELQKKAADVGLRMTQQALYDMKLRAPFGGVVTKVLAEEGQYITSMPPTVIFVLADTDTLEVRVPVPERLLSQIKEGLPVVVLLPSVGTQEYPAKIDRLAGVVDPMTRAAEAIITLPNRDHAIPAGVYARVRFPTLTDVKVEAAQVPAGQGR